jgi:hypothetical protein
MFVYLQLSFNSLSKSPPFFFSTPVNMQKIVLWLFAFFPCCSLWSADFTSIQSGDWNTPGTWTITSGSDADGIPDSDDNVTLGNLNVGLSQTESCNNLIHPGGAVLALSCAANTLEVYGTLTFNAPPASHSVITSSTASSGIRFAGPGRSPLFSGANNIGEGYSVEVACSGTSTLSNTIVGFANFTVSSGTLNVTQEVRLPPSGSVYVAAGATLNLGAVLGRNNAPVVLGSYCNAITIDGVLEMTSSTISAWTITINGTFRVKTTGAIVSDPNTSEWVYGGAAVLEYAASGECQMGAEIDRNTFSSSNNPVIPVLRVNRSGGGQAVQTNSKIPRVQNLDFVSGKVRCNGTPVVIVAGGSATGSNSNNYVITSSTFAGLRREGMGSGDFPIGTSSLYLPITAFNNGGVTDIFTAHVTASTPPCVAAAHSVTATWDIVETTTGGSNVALSFDYANAATGANYNANAAKIVHCSGSTIDYANGSVAGTVATGSGFTVFSPFGISSDPALPLELLSFSGNIAGPANIIEWETITEKNVQWHVIERSADGIHWTAAYKTPAVNSSHIHSYTWTDFAPFRQTYYRLHSIEMNGAEQVGRTLSLSRSGEGLEISRVYPLPVSDMLHVQFHDDTEEILQMRMADMQGRIVLDKAIETLRGTQITDVDIAHLPAGLYSLSFQGKTGIRTAVKFVKQ